MASSTSGVSVSPRVDRPVPTRGPSLVFAVADDEGVVAEFGCGEDAAEGTGAGAAEPVDMDRPRRSVAVDAPGRAWSCGGRDGYIAGMESGVGWGGVIDAAPRDTIASSRSEVRRGARDPTGDASSPAIDDLGGELCPAAVLEPEVVDAGRGGGSVGSSTIRSPLSSCSTLRIARSNVRGPTGAVGRRATAHPAPTAAAAAIPPPRAMRPIMAPVPRCSERSG